MADPRYSRISDERIQPSLQSAMNRLREKMLGVTLNIGAQHQAADDDGLMGEVHGYQATDFTRDVYRFLREVARYYPHYDSHEDVAWVERDTRYLNTYRMDHTATLALYNLHAVLAQSGEFWEAATEAGVLEEAVILAKLVNAAIPAAKWGKPAVLADDLNVYIHEYLPDQADVDRSFSAHLDHLVDFLRSNEPEARYYAAILNDHPWLPEGLAFISNLARTSGSTTSHDFRQWIIGMDFSFISQNIPGNDLASLIRLQQAFTDSPLGQQLEDAAWEMVEVDERQIGDLPNLIDLLSSKLGLSTPTAQLLNTPIQKTDDWLNAEEIANEFDLPVQRIRDEFILIRQQYKDAIESGNVPNFFEGNYVRIPSNYVRQYATGYHGQTGFAVHRNGVQAFIDAFGLPEKTANYFHAREAMEHYGNMSPQGFFQSIRELYKAAIEEGQDSFTCRGVLFEIGTDVDWFRNPDSGQANFCVLQSKLDEFYNIPMLTDVDRQTWWRESDIVSNTPTDKRPVAQQVIDEIKEALESRPSDAEEITIRDTAFAVSEFKYFRTGGEGQGGNQTFLYYHEDAVEKIRDIVHGVPAKGTDWIVPTDYYQNVSRDLARPIFLAIEAAYRQAIELGETSITITSPAHQINETFTIPDEVREVRAYTSRAVGIHKDALSKLDRLIWGGYKTPPEAGVYNGTQVERDLGYGSPGRLLMKKMEDVARPLIEARNDPYIAEDGEPNALNVLGNIVPLNHLALYRSPGNNLIHFYVTDLVANTLIPQILEAKGEMKGRFRWADHITAASIGPENLSQLSGQERTPPAF